MPSASEPASSYLSSHNQRLFIIIAYIALIALAGSVRLFTFDRYMPVIDHYDESLRFLHAYSIRPDAPLGRAYGEIEWEAGFPPFQPWFTGVVQRVVESQRAFPMPSDYIYVMKAISAVLGVLTTAILASTGWMLGRSLGVSGQALLGWLMALPWAIGPLIVATSNFALMDPLLFPMIAATIWCCVYAIQQDSIPALLGSLACVVLAIYTKYVAIYALWPVACATLVLIRRRGWRPMVPVLAVMALFSLVSAGYLVLGHGAFGLDNREANTFRSTGIEYLLSPARNLDNLAYTINHSVGLALFIVSVTGGALAYLYSRRHNEPVIPLGWLAVLLPALLGCILLTSSVDVISQADPKWFRVRYVLPVMPVITFLWAASLAQIMSVLRRQDLAHLGRLLVIIVVLIFSVPAISTDIAEARRFAQTHGKQVIWTWSDVNLPPEGKILMHPDSDLKSLWNRPYSGYNGITTFEWAYDNNPTHSTPSEFVAQGVQYLAVTSNDLMQAYVQPEIRTFIDSLYLLKTFPPNVETPYTTYFYRMLAPQVAIKAGFRNQIELVGYDLSGTTAQPGDVLTLRPYWQVISPPTANYSMFVHVLPAGNVEPVAQFDGAPANERRLPLTWDDPQEVIIGTVASITLPDDLPPGEYTLALGLYDFVSGARLTLDNSTDMLILTHITVQ